LILVTSTLTSLKPDRVAVRLVGPVNRSPGVYLKTDGSRYTRQNLGNACGTQSRVGKGDL
jgi:hypothetical protein